MRRLAGERLERAERELVLPRAAAMVTAEENRDRLAAGRSVVA
jgi:hypothetical protein